MVVKLTVYGGRKMAEEKLVTMESVNLKGEKIKEIIYLSFMGSWKQYWIFESGKVLVMPVYPGCPVQVGTVEDLKEDFPEMVSSLENEKKELSIKITQLNASIKNILDE